MALPATAQTFGTQQTDQLNAAFKSTSTMTGSGSQYSANPTLNADGTASYDGQQQASAPNGGPHKSKKAIDPSEEAWVPLGDALLPLMLCAVAFGGFIALRRNKRAEA